MIPDFTILCAVDASHIAELRASYPTWRRHKPDLCQRPMLVMCDLFTSGSDVDWWSSHQRWWASQLDFLADHPGGVGFRFISDGKDWPVRERVLSSLVFAAKHISTPYYFKADADLVATGMEDWIDPTWFRDSPAIIASAWGYTKPASMLLDFDRWADQHPEQFGALRLDYRIAGSVAKHRRVISYAMFGNTEWTRKMAELAGDRLPCPSQDTFLSGCAVRGGAKIRYAKMSDYGWRHVGGGGRRLEKLASEAMEAPIT